MAIPTYKRRGSLVDGVGLIDDDDGCVTDDAVVVTTGLGIAGEGVGSVTTTTWTGCGVSGANGGDCTGGASKEGCGVDDGGGEVTDT